MQLADQPEAQAGVTPFWAHPSAWLRTALQVRAIGRGKAAVIDSEGNLWAGPLRQVIADLDHLNHNTEQDFLRIGDKLGEFIKAVNLISCDLKALGSLISGEHGVRASQALTSALDHSREMAARVEEGNALLSSMRQEARLLKQNLSGFEGTVSTFRTLGVLMRIETARLVSSGDSFGHLADDVKLLAADVRTKVETALPATALLIPAIESAMQDVAALEEGQTKDLPSVISQVLANLSSFRDIEKQVNDASARLGDAYNAISDAFKKLIVSLQFHDITRQQVEHVIDVLRGLLSESGGAGGGILNRQHDTAAVVALQSMQLAGAGARFADSAASVVHNMDEIAKRVLEMADESLALSGLSADETTSFLLQMEGSCTAILASLSICATAQATIGATSGNLALIVGRTRGPVDDIQSIGIRIHRMAMNARIRAAHLGAAGEVLGVLAASMQQLASECGGRSESLIQSLDSMSQASATLSVRCTSAKSSHCQATIRAAVAELHSSNERSFAGITQIVVRSTTLREDLSTAREGFSVGPVFAQSVRQAREILDEIAKQLQPESLPLDSGGHERGIDDFARYYTMQAERDVHAGATTTVSQPVLGAIPVQKSDSPPKLVEAVGENVEFF